MQLRLADLVDARMLQSMMEDFHRLTRIPMALIDLEGTVIVGVGWQDVCTRFHRVNPETCAFCIESDTLLTADIPAGEMQLYHCKNGMWDAATPVLVGSERVGNLFTGQFFFDDEPVDLEAFRVQAQRYGFDEGAYLEAVEAVPRLSRATVETGMRFLTSLSTMISLLTFNDARRALAEGETLEALKAQIALAEDLGTQHNILNAIMENTAATLPIWIPISTSSLSTRRMHTVRDTPRRSCSARITSTSSQTRRTKPRSSVPSRQGSPWSTRRSPSSSPINRGVESPTGTGGSLRLRTLTGHSRASHSR